LVDALCSGRSVRKDVLVRIQSWALNFKSLESTYFRGFYLYINWSNALLDSFSNLFSTNLLINIDIITNNKTDNILAVKL
jgi:hypothetical protein